jgi:hypothetical protein
MVAFAIGSAGRDGRASKVNLVAIKGSIHNANASGAETDEFVIPVLKPISAND